MPRSAPMAAPGPACGLERRSDERRLCTRPLHWAADKGRWIGVAQRVLRLGNLVHEAHSHLKSRCPACGGVLLLVVVCAQPAVRGMLADICLQARAWLSGVVAGAGQTARWCRRAVPTSGLILSIFLRSFALPDMRAARAVVACKVWPPLSKGGPPHAGRLEQLKTES